MPGDVKLVTMTAQSGIAFFNDTNNSCKFELQEFTGLALSDGAKATIVGDVHGRSVRPSGR